MNKKQKTLIIRIVLLVGTITSMFFVPWLLVKAWILPLPDTVQEQVNEAIGHGFDGMIVYVDQAGKEPAFFRIIATFSCFWVTSIDMFSNSISMIFAISLSGVETRHFTEILGIDWLGTSKFPDTITILSPLGIED